MTADDLLAHWPHCRHTIKGSMETKAEHSVAMMHFLSKQKQRKTVVHKALEDCLNYTSFVLLLFQICFLAHHYR